jgi:hypothetical protein
MTKTMNGQNRVRSGESGLSAESIAASARAAAKGRGIPPVHDWDPPFSGDLDMRIARDGTWFYLGTPINRPELVRLFSTILRKDGERYVLVTPVEKAGITVEDVPFIAVDFEVEGSGTDQTLIFQTNVGDETRASADSPIRIARDEETGEPTPYVRVRANLEARIDRKSFYRLVELGCHRAHQGEDWFGVYSGGAFFPIIPSAELPK